MTQASRGFGLHRQPLRHTQFGAPTAQSGRGSPCVGMNLSQAERRLSRDSSLQNVFWVHGYRSG